MHCAQLEGLCTTCMCSGNAHAWNSQQLSVWPPMERPTSTCVARWMRTEPGYTFRGGDKKHDKSYTNMTKYPSKS